MTVRARVSNGRLVVDEPTTLPEGTKIDLVALDDDLDDTAPDKDVPGRFVLIGLSPRLRLLFVVSAESGERIRLISARRASPRQRKLYSHGP